MGKRSFGSFGKVLLDCLCVSSCSNACLCASTLESQDGFETRSLVANEGGQLVRLKDVVEEKQTLAFQLRPKVVVLRVSMHCGDCARKVEKHISKMEGVTSYQIDLETKMVVVIGEIVPFEVLESVSKVKFAQLWTSPL
ncbi:Heavy metal-associated domain, HMA [Dillenia turbinata]|uniref:Heavy metal-associated domain, HMA n=1 Tax=Dillenia turbinata TaxID=194707 RepID=A0AAN8ZKN0_9MAGN